MKYLTNTRRLKFKSAPSIFVYKNSSPKLIWKCLSIKTAHNSEIIMIFGFVTIEKNADYGFIHYEGLIMDIKSNLF